MSNHKVAVAVEIVLKAHSLVAQELTAKGLHADPDLIVRILEDGSCTDEWWLQSFWGSLLATSCTLEGTDELSRRLVGIFRSLQLFQFACWWLYALVQRRSLLNQAWYQQSPWHAR